MDETETLFFLFGLSLSAIYSELQLWNLTF